jgi:hypothetical protein
VYLGLRVTTAVVETIDAAAPMMVSDDSGHFIAAPKRSGGA